MMCGEGIFIEGLSTGTSGSGQIANSEMLDTETSDGGIYGSSS